MSKVIQEALQELNAKLVRAGYLQPALRHDADAITTPIARAGVDGCARRRGAAEFAKLNLLRSMLWKCRPR